MIYVCIFPHSAFREFLNILSSYFPAHSNYVLTLNQLYIYTFKAFVLWMPSGWAEKPVFVPLSSLSYKKRLLADFTSKSFDLCFLCDVWKWVHIFFRWHKELDMMSPLFKDFFFCGKYKLSIFWKVLIVENLMTVQKKSNNLT